MILKTPRIRQPSLLWISRLALLAALAAAPWSILPAAAPVQAATGASPDVLTGPPPFGDASGQGGGGGSGGHTR